MLGAINLLEIHNNQGSFNTLGYFLNNTNYYIPLGSTTSYDSVSSGGAGVRAYSRSEFESDFSFSSDFVPLMRELNNICDFEFYYQVTNYSSESLYIEGNLATKSDDSSYDVTTSRTSYSISCNANDSSYGYFGRSYLDVITNVLNLDNYFMSYNCRTGDNYDLSIYIIPSSTIQQNLDRGEYELELLKLKSIQGGLYQDSLDSVFDRGYNTGYSDAVNNSVGSYQEGFDKGQEIGYQKAQAEQTILVDTFELLGQGISATDSILSQRLTPNMTVGQVAFIPVTVAVISFLIRSLIA